MKNLKINIYKNIIRYLLDLKLTEMWGGKLSYRRLD